MSFLYPPPPRRGWVQAEVSVVFHRRQGPGPFPQAVVESKTDSWWNFLSISGLVKKTFDCSKRTSISENHLDLVYWNWLQKLEASKTIKTGDLVNPQCGMLQPLLEFWRWANAWPRGAILVESCAPFGATFFGVLSSKKQKTTWINHYCRDDFVQIFKHI